MKMNEEKGKNKGFSKGKMRKGESESSDLRKTSKCAKQVQISFLCELTGYDIKTLNSATGKGSYMLKAGTKDVRVPLSKSEEGRKVTLVLYKFKGLRGFLRRAAELRLLRLVEAGDEVMGPCTPTANYPHQEILKGHEALGYHLQGTCSSAKCFVRRLYGSLEDTATINVHSAYIAKATAEILPVEVNTYLTENIEQIFNLKHCVVYHNGDSTLKTETFNIINRSNDQAVNNFMKHTANGSFRFKIIFKGALDAVEEYLENIGFFVASLFEINSDSGLQLGADKTNGSGQVTIGVNQINANMKFPAIEKFIIGQTEEVRQVRFGDIHLKETEMNYQVDLNFVEHCLDLFKATIKRNAPEPISKIAETEA
ncbi:MAG TPA: hypothetical protein VMV49_12575 [Candidatus Deferrimicrobium sp.]|nr:hypothetical protein [Candidatus Deferrimicrobium sp.]